MLRCMQAYLIIACLSTRHPPSSASQCSAHPVPACVSRTQYYMQYKMPSAANAILQCLTGSCLASPQCSSLPSHCARIAHCLCACSGWRWPASSSLADSAHTCFNHMLGHFVVHACIPRYGKGSKKAGGVFCILAVSSICPHPSACTCLNTRP